MNHTLQTDTAPLLRTAAGQLRCAIYTRKSTDEGLDQEFNSLDAQREAAEAFIFSQRSGGLVALPERYDDGGFTGGNLDRPALDRLLADIRAGLIDCVVVYKVDRLSRSLVDFARIIEIFEKHRVSFVSVTQQFNTTNSLGRLTLNILLSFAQFEREIIAERTRDKISAARRKGKWIGGRPVLGYDIDSQGSRLIMNAAEAFHVRMIFKLYLDYSTLVPVVREIHRRGWRTKQWVTKAGVTHGGTPFTKGRLFRLLKNPIYIGKVGFENQIYDGEQEAIVEIATWGRVQKLLKQNGCNGGADVRDSYGSLLKGLTRCARCGGAMVCTVMTRNSRRFRHYVCAQAQQSGRASCETQSVSEVKIKAAVSRQIRRIGSEPRIVVVAIAKAHEHTRNRVEDLTHELQSSQKELMVLRMGRCELAQKVGAGQTGKELLADLEERIGQTEGRLSEIRQELANLERAPGDEGDLRATLAEFGPLWDSLNSREQARMIQILIERVMCNGKTKELTVTFRSTTIRNMCRGRKSNAAKRPSGEQNLENRKINKS